VRNRPRRGGAAAASSVILFIAARTFAELSTSHWLASDIYKADVYDPSEHKIGNVTDLMIDSNGNVTAAVIGVGGFLGVAQKDVVIPFKELKVSTREGKDWLVHNRTKDELKMAPIIRALRASIGVKEAMSADARSRMQSLGRAHGGGNEAVQCGRQYRPRGDAAIAARVQIPLRVKL
jgi:sporulation protein YlmC with PRC-barrel domain